MCLSHPDKEGGSGNVCLKEQEMEDLRESNNEDIFFCVCLITLKLFKRCFIQVLD